MVLIALEEKARMWTDDDGWMDVIEGLRTLHSESEHLNSVAQSFIETTSPEYYSELGAILEPGFWEVPLSTKLFNMTVKPISSSSEILNGVEQLVEAQSDNCVAEAAGTVSRDDGGDGDHEDDPGAQGQCFLSQNCWDLMTKPGYSGYSLTHQVFYIVIGLQAGCGDQEEHLAHTTFRNGKSMTVATLLEQLCYSILNEATRIAQAGFPATRQDLFMEQGALCGLIGYRDFFRKQWLAKVLSWQRSSGCFGDALLFYATHPQRATEGVIFRTLNARVKREERPMAGHCLAHRSAVAIGYLSLYVRHLALALFK